MTHFLCFKAVVISGDIAVCAVHLSAAFISRGDNVQLPAPDCPVSSNPFAVLLTEKPTANLNLTEYE